MLTDQEYATVTTKRHPFREWYTVQTPWEREDCPSAMYALAVAEYLACGGQRDIRIYRTTRPGWPSYSGQPEVARLL